MALARMVGHLTYMSADKMTDRFGRELRQGSFDPQTTRNPFSRLKATYGIKGVNLSAALTPIPMY